MISDVTVPKIVGKISCSKALTGQLSDDLSQITYRIGTSQKFR